MCLFRSLIVSALGIVSHASTMLRLSRLSPGVVPEEVPLEPFLLLFFCSYTHSHNNTRAQGKMAPKKGELFLFFLTPVALLSDVTHQKPNTQHAHQRPRASSRLPLGLEGVSRGDSQRRVSARRAADDNVKLRSRSHRAALFVLAKTANGPGQPLSLALALRYFALGLDRAR